MTEDIPRTPFVGFLFPVILFAGEDCKRAVIPDPHHFRVVDKDGYFVSAPHRICSCIYIHTCTHTHIHMRIHTCACTHAHAPTRIHTCTHTHDTHACSTHVPAHTYTHIRTHPHTYPYTHAQYKQFMEMSIEEFSVRGQVLCKCGHVICMTRDPHAYGKPRYRKNSLVICFQMMGLVFIPSPLLPSLPPPPLPPPHLSPFPLSSFLPF